MPQFNNALDALVQHSGSLCSVRVALLPLSKSTRIRPAVLGPEGGMLQEPRQGSSELSRTPAGVFLSTRSPSAIGYEEPVLCPCQ